MYSIGKLAQHTGVKVPTIRYYEQMGLIDTPVRSEGNQRRYSKGDAEQLGFIKHARDLGLSLDAIRELITLSAQPDYPCDDADRIARQHLQSIREKISKLLRLEKELKRIVEGCSSGSVVSNCYVLRSLGDHTLCDKEH